MSSRLPQFLLIQVALKVQIVRVITAPLNTTLKTHSNRKLLLLHTSRSLKDVQMQKHPRNHALYT